jgi:hypothetical protein
MKTDDEGIIFHALGNLGPILASQALPRRLRPDQFAKAGHEIHAAKCRSGFRFVAREVEDQVRGP